MAKTKVTAAANRKGEAGKGTSGYNPGAGPALSGKKGLMVDVDPQGDLTKMPGQRKPHEKPPPSSPHRSSLKPSVPAEKRIILLPFRYH